MALGTDQFLVVVGVLAVLLGVILYNNLKAGQATKAKAEDGPAVDPLLTKFVRHDGSIVGETVALDGEQVILKQSGEFKAVPRRQLTIEDNEVVLNGAVDWDAARAAGKAWHDQRRRGVDEAVSGQLTRSEDVQAPALAAIKAREERMKGRRDGDKSAAASGAASAEAPAEAKKGA